MSVLDELLERLCDRVPQPMPAAAIVVAHPDDETIGAGSRLPRLRHATLVHATDGSPRNLADAQAAGFETREAYARARRTELGAVMTLAGIAVGQQRNLGCVDQEATLALPALARRLAAMFDEQRPELVLTHPYEGGHPDHDATSFAVHAAVRLLQRDGAASPAIVEMASYHARDDRMVVHEFLPAEGIRIHTLALSDEERSFKQKLFDCYRSQRTVLQSFPIALERFRAAPRYDFTRAPHPGPPLYEQFPWGMTGRRFLELSAAALADLGLA